jgi:hypothetical protein
MAQYRGTVEGTRGQASRLGSKVSGLIVTANGWNVGAIVRIDHEDGKDVVRVWKSNGSAVDGRCELIAEYSEF